MVTCNPSAKIHLGGPSSHGWKTTIWFVLGFLCLGVCLSVQRPASSTLQGLCLFHALISAGRAGHMQQHTLLHVGTPLMSFSMGEVSARGPFFTCSAPDASGDVQGGSCDTEHWAPVHSAGQPCMKRGAHSSRSSRTHTPQSDSAQKMTANPSARVMTCMRHLWDGSGTAGSALGGSQLQGRELACFTTRTHARYMKSSLHVSRTSLLCMLLYRPQKPSQAGTPSSTRGQVGRALFKMLYMS